MFYGDNNKIKRHMKNLLTIIYLSAFGIATLQAQDLQKIAQKNSNKNWLNCKADVHLNEEEFLQEFKNIGLLSPNENLKKLSSKTDQKNGVHHYYQETYKDIPIEGAIYMVHEQNGRIKSANGKLVEFLELNTIPFLDEQQALEQALQSVNAEKYAWENPQYEVLLKQKYKDDGCSFYPQGDLLIVTPQLNTLLTQDRLCYKFDIYSLQPHKQEWVYVDAHNGEVFLKTNLLCQLNDLCTADKYYSCNNMSTVSFEVDNVEMLYYLNTNRVTTYDASNGIDSTMLAASDCNAFDPVLIEAHWAAQNVVNYFDSIHHLDGYDGNGAKIQNWVHADLIDIFHLNNNKNAVYNELGIWYGDGGGSGSNPYVSLDIVTHEIVHGITKHSANLYGVGESGALAESFADIFGVIIEHSVMPTCANWIIGENVKVNGIRDFANPDTLGQPDTYKGNHWGDDFEGYYGVHTNCGVQNHWFYLLVNGGTGTNDNNDDYTVNGIGMQAAAKIVYQNLMHYMTPYSNYADARNGSIEAALELFPEDSSKAQAVADAWYAVGVGSNLVNGDSIQLISPNGGEILAPQTTSLIEWDSSAGIDSGVGQVWKQLTPILVNTLGQLVIFVPMKF